MQLIKRESHANNKIIKKSPLENIDTNKQLQLILSKNLAFKKK